MNAISDHQAQGGKPPILQGNALPSLEDAVRAAAFEEEKTAYQYHWTLYLTDGGKCSYEDILAAFRDIHEYILEQPVLEDSLVGQSGAGFHLKHGEEWVGNPKDGFRRSIELLSGGFKGIHLVCWIAEEWQHETDIFPRFELPLEIKSNWDWPSEKELWQFITQRFAKIGYQDTTLRSSFKTDILARLAAFPEEVKLLEERGLS